jgi:hypothetical protein
MRRISVWLSFSLCAAGVLTAMADAAQTEHPDVRNGSNSAVPSTTEHSRSTFSCGRTVTLPNRPEVAEPQNRKLEAVDRRRIETPYKPLYAADVARKYPNGGGT